MVGKYLGDEFDIHGGGLDLRFPHHENEIAQSKAAGRPFARYWLHNAMVNLAGEKMAKSVGNFMLVSEVVKRIRPIVLRYYLVAPHYRSIIEFSEESLHEAAAAFGRLEGFIDRATEVTGGVRATGGELSDDFVAAMYNDLGTPAAIAAVHEVVRDGNKLLAAGDSEELRRDLASVRAMLGILGLDPKGDVWEGSDGTEDSKLRGAVDVLVRGLLDQRQQARAAKDFATADAVRDQLKAAGVEVEDTPQGPRWTIDG
jgi:cysteinyl-tRNA synthetase